MTIGTSITNAAGIVQTNNQTGVQLPADPANTGFSPYGLPVTNWVETGVTQSVGLNSPVNTLSGSGQILTVAIPAATSCPGAYFIFRAIDARAHVLTGSNQAGKSIALLSGTVGVIGSKLTMQGTAGSSLSLESDGNSWTCFPMSGALPTLQ